MEFEAEDGVCVLDCKHCYHTDCIAQWLKYSKVIVPGSCIFYIWYDCHTMTYLYCASLHIILVTACQTLLKGC